MDEIAEQALINMASVLQSFLPTAAASIDQSLILIPKKIKATGLSGYVGVHEDPDASLVGRHIQAISEVTLISDNGIADLQQAVSNLTHELLAQDRATLINNGIYKLQFDQVSDIVHQGTGSSTTDTRLVRFDVDFEFVPVPIEEEGTIGEFIHNFDLALSKGKAKFHQLNFATLNSAGENPLDYFDFIDDPDVAGSSPVASWSFDAGEGYIEQTNNVRGGPANSGGKKAGAHALVRLDESEYLAENFIARANLKTTDPDGIGLVFRKQDDDNFYYLLFSARHDYTLIGKKVAGSYSSISIGGLNESIGHTENTVMEIKLVVDGESMAVYRNDQFVVSGADSDLTGAGRLGLLTHRNSAAHFYDIAIVEFS